MMQISLIQFPEKEREHKTPSPGQWSMEIRESPDHVG
jgi:hypothetical protein